MRNFIRPSGARGFALVGVLISSVILLMIMAAMVKLVRNSHRSENVLRQLSDFDTIKTNVKSIIVSESKCLGAFRSSADHSKNAVFDTVLDPTNNLQKVSLGSVYLYQGPLVTAGDSYGNGLVIDEIALEEVPGVPAEQVTRVVGSLPMATYDRRLVSLKIKAQSAGGGQEQMINPQPRISILTKQGTKEIVGCDLSASSQSSPDQLCTSMNGTWDGSKCSFQTSNTSLSKSCESGSYLTGFAPDGSLICQRIPVQPAIPAASCPTDQIMNGIDEHGSPICVAPTALSFVCPTGQVLTGVNKGAPICSPAGEGGGSGSLTGYCIENQFCRSAFPPALCGPVDNGYGYVFRSTPVYCNCPAGYSVKFLGAGLQVAYACLKL